MRALARASWLVPCVALATLGLMEKAPAQPPPGLVLGILLVVVAFGTVAALIARRHGERQALLGLGANAAVALLLGLSALAGMRARERLVAESARIRQSVTDEMAGTGWAGGARVGEARLFAAQIAHGELKEMMARSFHQPFALLLMGVDNRRGSDEVVLDLTHVELIYADGHEAPGIDRAEVMASAAHDDEDLRSHAAPYRVPRGAAFESALAFLPAATDFPSLAAVRVRVNGAPLLVRGRWLTAEQKRAHAR